MQTRLSQWLTFWQHIYNRLLEVECTYRAAALTFTTLLAIVPLMSVSFTILAAFPVFNHITVALQNLIFKHFIVGSGEVIHQYLNNFMHQASSLSVKGLAFLVVTAVLMIRTMEGAFNAIWKIRKRRQGISAFLLYWSILTLVPILIGLSMGLSSYLFSLPLISGTAKHLGLTTPLLKITPFILSTIGFTLLYIAMPNCRVPIRTSIVGAMVAALCFETAKRGFGFYISHFPTYKIIYGALAAIPLFFIWVYVAWLIILLGAVLSNALAVRYNFKTQYELDGFTQAYRWLGYFWQAQTQGKTLSLWNLLKLDRANYRVPPEQQLNALIQAKLIHHVDRDRYILSRDLSALTLADLYKMLPWKLPAVTKLPKCHDTWDHALQQQLKILAEHTQQDLNVPLVELYKNTE